MAINQGSEAPASRNPKVRAMTRRWIAERRHQQVLKQLRQINVRLETVSLALDRQQVLEQLRQINVRLETLSPALERQQVLEQLHQINVGLAAVTVALDRQSKLTAETNAKLDGVMKYFVENWKLLRQRARPRR
jgi:hypothetical protein